MWDLFRGPLPVPPGSGWLTKHPLLATATKYDQTRISQITTASFNIDDDDDDGEDAAHDHNSFFYDIPLLLIIPGTHSEQCGNPILLFRLRIELAFVSLPSSTIDEVSSTAQPPSISD